MPLWSGCDLVEPKWTVSPSNNLKLTAIGYSNAVAAQGHVGRGVFAKESQKQSSGSVHILEGQQMTKIPFEMMMTNQTPFDDSKIGRKLYDLMIKTEIRQRDILAMYIALQKTLGDRSEWRRWIAMLPETVEVPLHYQEEALSALKGTPMHKATISNRRSMQQTWRLIQSQIRQICREGGYGDGPTMEAFLWAKSITWSRSVDIPESDAYPDLPPSAIVPCLDFFNHSSRPNCRWKVVEDGGQYYFVVKVLRRCRTDEELTINYGNTSNRNFLCFYGFVIDMNPYDTVQIELITSMLPRQKTQKGWRGWRRKQKDHIEVIQIPETDLTKAEEQLGSCQTQEQYMSLIPEDVWNALQHVHASPLPLVDSMEFESGEYIHIHVMELLKLLKTAMEHQREHLEGDEGTGMLYSDVQLMNQFVQGQDPSWLWNCLVYRSKLKQLVGDWLKLLVTVEQEMDVICQKP